jgi:hypothetical protein
MPLHRHLSLVPSITILTMYSSLILRANDLEIEYLNVERYFMTVLEFEHAGYFQSQTQPHSSYCCDHCLCIACMFTYSKSNCLDLMIT